VGRVELAKPALDVGLYTNNLDDMLAFWQDQAHVSFSELLKVGGGVHQHRHAIGDSVLKINHNRNVQPQGNPTGLHKLQIYTPAVDTSIELLDPDGNELELLPASATSPNLCLHLNVNNLQAHTDFYAGVLGLEQLSAHTYGVGTSQIKLAQRQVAPFERAGIGYRYMTFQVFDVVHTHQQILSAGGSEGMAPVRLGEVAYISFVLDPDGNWIELSQRKSITGSLE